MLRKHTKEWNKSPVNGAENEEACHNTVYIDTADIQDVTNEPSWNLQHIKTCQNFLTHHLIFWWFIVTWDVMRWGFWVFIFHRLPPPHEITCCLSTTFFKKMMEKLLLLSISFLSSLSLWWMLTILLFVKTTPRLCRSKLTLKLYTDGICFKDWVFSIFNSSSRSKPTDGSELIEVPDKSLTKNVDKWNLIYFSSTIL